MASGVYGLYCYVLLLVPMATGIVDGTVKKLVPNMLIAVTLFVALPLGLLLLLAMPCG